MKQTITNNDRFDNIKFWGPLSKKIQPRYCASCDRQYLGRRGECPHCAFADTASLAKKVDLAEDEEE